MPEPVEPRIPRKPVHALRRKVLDWSIKNKLTLIIGLLIGNLTIIISLAVFSFNILSGIRAAVAGESLWAKAQKTAVFNLGRYAFLKDEKIYREYLNTLKIPLGYEKGNVELRKKNPDTRIVDQAFIEGGIHPDDVPGLTSLFIRFKKFPHIGEALAAWGGAQGDLRKVQELGLRIHQRIRSGSAGQATLRNYVDQLDALNVHMTELEAKFSHELGIASRLATNLCIAVMVLGSLLIGLVSVALAAFISSAIIKNVEQIAGAASRAAGGDLKVRVNIESQDELGKLARAFNHMVEGLGKIDVMKTEFFSNVSHEFRTPLTLMLGPLEEELRRENDPVVRENLETVHRNALRLLKLVNSLLDFSRLESGKMKASFAATDLSSFTRDLASQFQSAVDNAGLQYEVDCAASPRPVYIDPDLWEKIVFNLLSNALKFTFKGSIRLKLSYLSDTACLEVQDTGTGIPSEELSHLFERFHRIQGARSRTHEGSGIGLSMVQELTRLHGGRVEVQSQENLGTTFRIFIPFGLAHLPSDQVSVSEQTPLPKHAAPFLQEADLWLPNALGEKRSAAENPLVLVVDDNADMRAYIARILSSEWNVELVSNGEEALAAIDRRIPDIVLSDIMMPGMNGFQLLARLRQGESTQHIPIILLSARAGEEAKAEGISAGADDYLVKPFSAKELMARVKTHLQLSRVREKLVRDSALISRLEEEQQSLSHTVEARDEFLSIASHELRTPITSLRLQLQLSQRELKPAEGVIPSAERLARMLGIFGSQIERLTSLVEDLLDVSRMRSGKLTLNTEYCNLSEVLRLVLGRLQVQAQSAQCTVDERIEEGIWTHCDKKRIEQVITNVFVNAVKYAPGKLIKISLRQNGERVFLTVQDSGPGIKKELQERLFDRFERGGASKNVSGLGLGLYISRQIMKAHNGEIVLVSEPGEGASFTLILPTGNPLSEQLPPKPASSQPTMNA